MSSRAGQANVYVDDTDIGYVVSVASGSTYGSLNYALNNDVGEYVVFSRSLDGEAISVSGGTYTISNRALHIVGNGIDKTEILSDDYTTLHSNSAVSITGCKINFSVKGGNNQSTGVTLNDVLIDGATSTQDVGSGIITNAVNVSGCTFKNCVHRSTASNNRAVVDGYPLNATITNCLFLHNNMLNIFAYGTSISGCTFSSTNQSFGIISVYNRARTTTITNCIFEDTDRAALAINGSGYNITSSNYCDIVIDGCTFGRNNNIRTGSGTNYIYNKVTFSGINVLNATVSGDGSIVFANGSTITSTGDGSAEHPRGVIDCRGQSGKAVICSLTGTNPVVAFDNIVISGGSDYTNGISHVTASMQLTNCLITGCTTKANAGSFIVTKQVVVKGSTFSDCRTAYGFISCRNSGNFLIENTEFSNCVTIGGAIYCSGPCITSVRNVYMHGGSNSNVYISSGYATVYMSGTTANSLIYANTSASATVTIDGTCDINVITGWGGVFNVLRVVSGVTLTLGNTQTSNNTTTSMSVGTYSEDGNIYTVGGTASVIMKTGSTISISGIGTYIAADGTNDFTTPYMVVNTSSTGAGSLLYGLVGSTKYVVVSHSVTSCSAVLTTDVNRVLHICTGDGRTIVGGSVSIPNASTVSVNTTVDEHGGAQVAGSTVTVEGGTTTLSGNVLLSGTLKPVGGLVLANGTTVSGVGAGAAIDFEWGHSFEHEYGSRYLIQGVTIANAYRSGSGVGAINIQGNSYIRYKNCVITGGHSYNSYGNIGINANGIILENCYIGAGKAGTNTTNNGNVYVGGSASLTITGCTVAVGYISLHNSSTLTITGKNKINGVVKISWAQNDYHIIIKSDAIIDMSTATGNINSLTTSGITVEDGAKIIPYGSSTAQSLPAGTYTTIARDGTCTV